MSEGIDRDLAVECLRLAGKSTLASTGMNKSSGMFETNSQEPVFVNVPDFAVLLFPGYVLGICCAYMHYKYRRDPIRRLFCVRRIARRVVLGLPFLR